jgi:hypothetical protein
MEVAMVAGGTVGVVVQALSKMISKRAIDSGDFMALL